MKSLKEYLQLPYTVILRKDEDGDYVARVDELRGCSAHGKTPQEALASLEEAQELWIADCIESGQPVPEPAVEEPLPSGKWVQRVPRSLHRKLSALAKREGVSLNQLVTSMLSEAVGARTVPGGESQLEAAGIWDKGCLYGSFFDLGNLQYAGQSSSLRFYTQSVEVIPEEYHLTEVAIPDRFKTSIEARKLTHEDQAYSPCR